MTSSLHPSTRLLKELEPVLNAFQLSGHPTRVELWEQGHIHDSYRVTSQNKGLRTRYLVQRLNQQVFKDPGVVMDNLVRITRHQVAGLRESKEVDWRRRVLQIVPCRDGEPWLHLQQRGEAWRCLVFIERARCYDQIQGDQQAYQAGRTLGDFQRQLRDLPLPALRDTIPDFHNLEKRFSRFSEAVESDSWQRCAGCQPEIEFAHRGRTLLDTLLRLHRDRELRDVVVHNDAKLNNVLFDAETGEGLCMIDLDTVMNGSVLYDFGDLVRTAACLTAEDERNLERIFVRIDLYQALLKGYLDSVGSLLNDCEKRHLAFSGRLMTFEVGLRFLTDYLEGDSYFKTQRPSQNLDRCRAQFRLVESLEAQQHQMNRLI